MVDEALPGFREAAKKPVKTFAGHHDYKKDIMDIIDELGHESLIIFSKDDVFAKSDAKGIPRAEAETAFENLLEDRYIHEDIGKTGLYSRSKYQDYSPAYEELPEW